MESLTSGTIAGTGTFRCDACGHVVEVTAADALPACPGCSGATFTRTSLFVARAHLRPLDGERTGADEAIEAACDAIDEAGRFLVFHDAGAVRTVAMPGSTMRIGRSLSAHLRFEDPTVSRRHAVLVVEGASVRLLDDRSLNGVFVNGERIVSRLLADGDEIIIGRYRLRFVEATAVRNRVSGTAPAGE